MKKNYLIGQGTACIAFTTLSEMFKFYKNEYYEPTLLPAVRQRKYEQPRRMADIAL